MASHSGKRSKVDQVLEAALAGNVQRIKAVFDSLVGKLKLIKELDTGKGRELTITPIRGSDGRGLLQAAAAKGKINDWKYVLGKLKFDVDALDEEGIAAFLHEMGFDTAVSDKHYKYALHLAALMEGANVNAPRAIGTPPQLAAELDAVNVLQTLLDNSAKVYFSYENGSPVEGKNIGRHVNDRLQQTYTTEQDGIHFASDGVIGLINVGHFLQNSMDSTVVLDDILSDKTVITGSAKISGSLNEGDKKSLRRPFQFFNAARIPSRDITRALRGQELENSQEALDVSSTLIIKPRPLVGDKDGYSHTICVVAIHADWVIFATDSRVTSGGATVPQVIHDTVRKYYTFGPYYVMVTGRVMVAAAVLSRFRVGINMEPQESEVRLITRAYELHMHLQVVMAENNIMACSNEFLIGSVEMSNGQFTEIQVYRVHQKGVNKRLLFHAIGSGIAYIRDLAENSGWENLEFEAAKKKVVEAISLAVHNDATCGGALDIVSVKISNGELEQDVSVIDLGEMCRDMGISDRSPKLPSPFNNNTEVRRSINLDGDGYNMLTQDEFLENVFQL